MIPMEENKAFPEKARKFENEFGELDPNYVYHTLIDPFPQIRQDKVECAKEDAQAHKSGELDSVQEVFEGNFQFHNKKQFKILPISVVSGTKKSFFFQKHVLVGKRLGL